MRPALLLLSTLLLAGAAPGASAAAWCATVTDNIPDDYLNVRKGPGIEYAIIEQIYPGDAVSVSDARCGLDEFGVTLCTGVSSDWRMLQQRLGSDMSLSGGTNYFGWVNTIYLTEMPCLE
jgi:hypothetical protein